jgi:hypothetical protein
MILEISKQMIRYTIMKFFRAAICVILLVPALVPVYAGDTLPSFSVKNRLGKIIISWVNNFPELVQISIQRSPDSLRGYKTILTVPDASAITNGYLDNKAPDQKSFYRLYVQQPGGKYFFTKPARPIVDTSRNIKYEIAKNNQVTIRNNNGHQQTDSMAVKAPEVKPSFIPSSFVFTNIDGNVSIALPNAKQANYTLKFYREDDTPLFQMSRVKEEQLTLDKSNFVKSGWFKFELFENEMLKEKHKFFIPRDLR